MSKLDEQGNGGKNDQGEVPVEWVSKGLSGKGHLRQELSGHSSSGRRNNWCPAQEGAWCPVTLACALLGCLLDLPSPLHPSIFALMASFTAHSHVLFCSGFWSGFWMARHGGSWVQKWRMEPNPKDHILYNPPAMKHPAQTNHSNRRQISSC